MQKCPFGGSIILFLSSTLAAGEMPTRKEGEPPHKIPHGIEIIRDIGFKQVGEKTLHLDLYLPKGDSERPSLPLIVYVHGGGYRRGTRNEIVDVPFMNETLLEPVAQSRFAVASIDYRKASKKAPFRLLVEDTRDAVNWLTERAAKYRFDSKRIGFVGETSGGHLALLAGLAGEEESAETNQDETQLFSASFIIAFAPPADLTRIAERVTGSEKKEDKKIYNQLKLGLGGKVDEVPEAYANASPVTLLQKSSPPTLVIVGAEDVRREQANWLREAADRAEAPLEMIAIENAGTKAYQGYEEMVPSIEELRTCLRNFIFQQFDIGISRK